MPLVSLRAVGRIARAGDVRGRLRAVRDGQAALRVAVVHAGLRTGVLAELTSGRTTDELVARLGVRDAELLRAYLRVLVAHSLVTTRRGVHVLTRRGRTVLDDTVVRAGYEAFGGFHGDLYRGLPEQLRGGPGRHDVEDRAAVIADLSTAMQPLVEAALARQVRAVAPARLLDVGCGEGALLRHALTLAPDATGLGVELDPPTAARAQAALGRAGLQRRASIACGDVRELLGSGRLDGPFGLVLLANVLYYVPPAERAGLLRSLAGLLAPGGRLVIITTTAERSAFSRHFDLLLHAQQPALELPSVDAVTSSLAGAGLTLVASERIVPGDPLHLLSARVVPG